MRRALFGGIGLALGVFVNPAAGQDARTAPPPVRAAKLGAPVAVPEPTAVQPDGEVTPAGLRTRLFGTPTPVTTLPPGATLPGTFAPGAPLPGTVYGAVVPGVQATQPPAGGTTAPTPRPVVPGTPSVTEQRNADGTIVYPPGYAGNGHLIPSIVPGTTIGGMSGLESPLYADCAPSLGACDRVRNCGKWWFGAEYLAWWTNSNDLPALVTTSSPQFQGIPGLGNTTAILAGSFGANFHSGGRFTVGRWWGDGQCRGFEGRIFFLAPTTDTFAATPDRFPLIARPFFNVNTPFGPFSEVVSDPTRGLGSVVVNLQSSVWGAETNYRRYLFGNPCARVDAIVGYRYLGIKEELSITESFTRTGGPPITVGGVPVVAGVVNDTFRAENQFHGGQIGLVGELHRGRWSLDARATVAFGNVTQTAEIGGSQTLALANGTTANFAGGLLALPGANIGRYSQNQFAVIPEVGLNVGYQLTQRLRVFVGYNFLYLGNALRPEGLIDTNVDAARIPNFPLPGSPAPLPGLPRPAPQFRLSDYVVQGINFGLQYRW